MTNIIMKPYSLFILSFFMIFNISCTHKSGSLVDISISKATPIFETYTNIVYGEDSLEQSFDMYLPAHRDRNNTGVIIFIHGGGWSGGVKDDFNGLGMDTFFTQKNYAVLTINYRLINKYPYPSALDDIGHVIDYIDQHADIWNVNSSAICLFGRSSGAHLALLYAYTRNSDHRIKAVVDCFGPSDLTASNIINGQLRPFLEAMLGPYVYNDMAWHDASPIYHLSGAIPTAIMQGTADSLVPSSQSITLQDSLLIRSIPSIYLSWQGNGHGWSQTRWLENRNVIVAWLKNYM